jgi:condensin complex subunit 1
LRPFDAACFRDVVQYLLSFVGKDKQSEGLADKLLHRFDSAVDARTWRDAAYCLSQLSFNEKIVKGFVDSIRLYKKSLVDDDVWHSFQSILAKCRKISATKPELKDAVAEWEVALQESRSGSVEDSAADAKAMKASRQAAAIAASEGISEEMRAQAASALAAAATAASLSLADAGKATKVVKKAVRVKKETVDEDVENKKAPVAAKKPAPRKKSKAIVESDSEGDDEDSDGSDAPAKKTGLKSSAAANASKSKLR